MSRTGFCIASLRRLPLLFGLTLLLAGVPARGMTLAALDADLHGFLDGRAGLRTQNDAGQRDTSLAETRLQLALYRPGDAATLQLRSDFVYDNVAEDSNQDLETGTGVIDLREANLLLTPIDMMDVKLGRQILTWGTGDLVFINDLFPKDWRSFFIGRDEEYLKAPSDALFISLFPAFASIDLVYVPRFDADRYIRGERLSYWNPQLGRRVGREALLETDPPDAWLRDDELALRLSRTLGGYELALYGYDGFWKSPQGFDPASGRAIFPKLRVYGASLRGSLAGGVLSLEGGYYDSRDDRHGDDPLLPNSERRLLVGYEREVVRNLTAGLQYYLEYMEDFRRYLDSLPGGMPARDRDRQLLTLRLTQQLLNQNLTLSLFCYYSPSDEDGYLRPNLKYKLSDAWLLTAGGNLFAGADDYTFFGQFEDNSNIYVGVRYSF